MMNMQKMMKQVQKMQAEIARVQEELGSMTVEGTAGGRRGDGRRQRPPGNLEVKIDPAVIDPEDPELLEDSVLAAVNEALRKAQELAESEMAKVTGNLKIPGLPGMPGFNFNRRRRKVRRMNS